MSEVKMAIIVNVGADMSVGRLAAQAAHAATLALLQLGSWQGNIFSINTTNRFDLEYWMTTKFTKVVLKVGTAEELFDLEREAINLRLSSALMVEDDAQVTALAIGPVAAERLEPITKNLFLW